MSGQEVPTATAPANANAQSEPDTRTQITNLMAQATREYSLKQYSEASGTYAQASELQAGLNGETNPENAELLYLYGRSLYQVGVSKSDVLGDGGGGDEAAKESGGKPAKKQKKASAAAAAEPTDDPLPSGDQKVAEEVVTKVVEEKGHEPTKKDESVQANKPYFQFTGDENFDDSDEEEEEDEGAANGEGGGGPEEEEEDDLTAAWNVLDLAHVLFERKLQQAPEIEGKGKGKGLSEDVRHIKERLSDTHDLLAEISLEGERFPSAVTDFRASLALKKDLYPQESSLIAEAHLKLSLALEFASLTTTRQEGGEVLSTADTQTQVDEAGRTEAAEQMEAAINSCKLRIQKEEAQLSANKQEDDDSKEKAKATRKSIEDVKEMVADMEQRLTDLKAPPVSVEAALSAGPAGAPDGSDPMAGILGAVLGESPGEQKARIEGAMKGANDLTGLVKKKKPDASTTSVNGSGKRDVDAAGGESAGSEQKKPRVDP